ncbi:GTPase Era [Candidatus Entotheonellaceae bacterium PAL068K]
MKPLTEACCIIVVGKESVGKTQLVASLTGRTSRSQNFRGSTVSVESYEADNYTYIDTPGILQQSDTETTRLALEQMTQQDTVLLVVQATHLDDDLHDLLPLLRDKRGAVVVTFWDKVHANKQADKVLANLSQEVGVSFIPVDARRLSAESCQQINAALSDDLHTFSTEAPMTTAGWRIEPQPGWLEHPVVGRVLALCLLLLPVALTIFGANAVAAWLDPIVDGWFAPMTAWMNATLPIFFAVPLAHDYGLLNMGPFLLVWAIPTVLLYAGVLGIYKSSGLIERMIIVLNPLLRPFGLSSRDALRVMMGLGCNVPAVISTRSCSGCSRGPTIHAIAFGAACSYQLPATLAVLAAVQQEWLIIPFLFYLALTTLIYLRLTSPEAARSPFNVLMIPRRSFLEWPRAGALWREFQDMLSHFVIQALPVFLLICIVASYLSYVGGTELIAHVLRPVMVAFNLPLEVSLPVVMASIRKDGIFLFVEGELLRHMSVIQVLTGVYLAGVLLPCLVTALTIAREVSWRFTGGLLLRQTTFVIGFSLILAWGGMILV